MNKLALTLLLLYFVSFGSSADRVDICYYDGVVASDPVQNSGKVKFEFSVRNTKPPTEDYEICKETIGTDIKVSFDVKENESIQKNEELQLFVFYKKGKQPLQMGLIKNEKNR